MKLRKRKATLVFTTNIDKVPSIKGNKQKKVEVLVNKTKADIAKEKLSNLFE